MKLTKNLKIAANPEAIVRYMSSLVTSGYVDLTIAYNATAINIVAEIKQPVSGNASFHDCWRELRRQLVESCSEYVTQIDIHLEYGKNDWGTTTTGPLFAIEHNLEVRNLRGELIRSLL